MKLKLITYLLVLIVFTGCSKEPALNYSAPTNEQITTYVAENNLEILDSIWIKDCALILLKNSLITLYSDQHEELYDHKLTWGSNDKDLITVGNGVPYIAIILHDDLKNKGATYINVKYSDGTIESRGITHKKGLIISNFSKTTVQNISVTNAKGEEIYSK
ncbi:hypothetical protein [Paenibacillus methanolicus]|uniref:Uncharacterized protein n=1 Tax=Paenibacillus methanolicus TaxID=582686 RepID=A0A5S5C0G9_9BACL|nr:hypothetical protein [Paenibacillus methanolicus]TYP72108.1 hypothetical protein BCM02_109387 [Paenibacillus methanolicus]